MKSCRTPLLICLLLLTLAAPLAAVTGSWRSVGPDGGLVFALASPPGSPQVIYASVMGGVYKSVDGGETWRWSGRGLDVRDVVENLFIDPSHPSTLYASLSGDPSGLFKSVNGGATWTRTGLPSRLGVYDLAIHPRWPQTLFAATSQGLFTSTNGGGKWKRITRGLLPPPYNCFAVVIDPSSPRRMYASIQNEQVSQGGIFKSLDGGFSWQPVRGWALEESVLPLVLDPRSPRVLYASTQRGLFRTSNGGDTWARVSGPVRFLAFHPTQMNVVYAADDRTVLSSLDQGMTWSEIAQGLPPLSFISGLLVSPTQPATLHFAADGPPHQAGVYKSTDGGIFWRRSNRGLAASIVNSIAVDADDSSALWAIDNYVPVRSVDRGLTWNRALPEPLPDDRAYAVQVVSSPADPRTVYVVRWDRQVLRSRDGGESWTIAGHPNPDLLFLRADPRDPLTLWASVFRNGIRKSTDGGDTWSSPVGPSAGVTLDDLAFAPSSPATVYAAGFRVFLRSTDAGATWTSLQSGAPSSLGNLAIDPLQPGTVYINSGEGIYKTLDGGGTWTLISRALPDWRVQWLIAAPSGSLYAAVRDDNVYASENGGLSWSPLGAGTGLSYFNALAADPDDPCRVYAATGGQGLRAFTRTGTATCP